MDLIISVPEVTYLLEETDISCTELYPPTKPGFIIWSLKEKVTLAYGNLRLPHL